MLKMKVKFVVVKFVVVKLVVERFRMVEVGKMVKLVVVKLFFKLFFKLFLKVVKFWMFVEVCEVFVCFCKVNLELKGEFEYVNFFMLLVVVVLLV